MTSLLNLPSSERPRERLLEEGVEALSLSELFALILGSGTKGKSVLDLSEEMLVRFGGLSGLIDASIPELLAIKGIGKAKAIQLKAVFGIIRKTQKLAALEKSLITTPEDVYEIAKIQIAHLKQEVVLVILRDAKGRLIHHERVAMGSLSEVFIHPREVFYPAVKHKAHSLIVAHNHPSGDPTPSNADLELTRILLQCSFVMGIGIDDHLIVAPHSFVSLRKKGILTGKGNIY
jgi:DNA repair protein RadC